MRYLAARGKRFFSRRTAPRRNRVRVGNTIPHALRFAPHAVSLFWGAVRHKIVPYQIRCAPTPFPSCAERTRLSFRSSGQGGRTNPGFPLAKWKNTRKLICRVKCSETSLGIGECPLAGFKTVKVKPAF
jgi:hypothetical protein